MNHEDMSGTYQRSQGTVWCLHQTRIAGLSNTLPPFEQSQVLSGFINNRDIVYHEEDGSFLQTTSSNAYIGFDSSRRRPFQGPCAEGALPRMEDGVFQKKPGETHTLIALHLDMDTAPGQMIAVHVLMGSKLLVFFCKYHQGSGMLGALLPAGS